MSPVEIRVLLHYYVTCFPYEGPEKPDFICTLLASFLQDDLLSLHEGIYKVTEKGEVYCEALQAVPLPRQTYIVDWPLGHG